MRTFAGLVTLAPQQQESAKPGEHQTTGLRHRVDLQYVQVGEMIAVIVPRTRADVDEGLPESENGVPL